MFGADTGTSALNLNEEFDPATNSWRTVTPMITPRSSTSGAVLSGRIFAPGGKGADQQHNLTVNEAFVLGAPPPVSTAFLVQSGQVVMEAENAHGNVSRGGKMWVSQTGPAGLVGSALQALPNTAAQIDTGYATTTAELQFQVQFPAAGTYHVWLRGYAANAQDNAAHVGVDGAGGVDVGPADAADLRGVDVVQEHDGRAGGDGGDWQRRGAHDQCLDAGGRAVCRSGPADDQRELDADRERSGGEPARGRSDEPGTDGECGSEPDGDAAGRGEFDRVGDRRRAAGAAGADLYVEPVQRPGDDDVHAECGEHDGDLLGGGGVCSAAVGERRRVDRDRRRAGDGECWHGCDVCSQFQSDHTDVQ